MQTKNLSELIASMRNEVLLKNYNVKATGLTTLDDNSTFCAILGNLKQQTYLKDFSDKVVYKALEIWTEDKSKSIVDIINNGHKI